MLENFIGDLVSGTYTNGSDECRLADEWFNRCWFGMFPENTFLKYLIDLDDVEDTVNDWEEIKYYKELEELNEDDKEDLVYYEESINDKFEEYQEYREDGDEEVTLEAEMEKVIKWWDQYRQMFN